MPCQDRGLCELPGANLCSGMAWDGVEHISSLWVSDVVEQAAELEKSVDSSLRETKSFTSVTGDDLQTTWTSTCHFIAVMKMTACAFRMLLCDSEFKKKKTLHFRERKNKDSYYILFNSLIKCSLKNWPIREYSDPIFY